MTAETYDIAIDQGADWDFTLRWKVGPTKRSATPKNTTGYDARMQVRETYTSAEPVLELTTENAGIQLGIDGSFQFYISASAAAGIEPGMYVYDIEAIAPAPDNRVSKLLRGSFRVVPEVTRP